MSCTITVNGVEAYILADGHQKGGRYGEGFWRRVRYKCPFEGSDSFIEGLLGVMTSVGGGMYPIPHQYPNNQTLYCISATQTETQGPSRPDEKLLAADWSIIEAEYGPLPFPMSTDDDPGGAFSFDGTPRPFRRVAMRQGMRTYDVPDSVFEFSDDGEETWENADGFGPQQVIVPQIEYVYTYEMYPSLPHAMIRTLNGTVNHATFFGCEHGTLLFTGGESGNEPNRSPMGGWLANMQFSLTWQPVDWNKQINPLTGNLVTLRRRGGIYNYPYVNFGVLTA